MPLIDARKVAFRATIDFKSKFLSLNSKIIQISIKCYIIVKL